jgi:FtsP/CotA-like multicopper oxidase with cupredoxin domain
MRYPLIALIGIIVAVITGTIIAALYRSPISAQDSSKTQQLGGHTPGYPLVKTTGDILDPTSVSIDPKSAAVDAAKYLRQFDYGRISKAPNGTTIREFTLIASDRQTKEISPGVFYNVWTFNGTVPAPTLRATEGDLIRINFINNGTHFHTLHFHGIHPAEMDGVFEGIAPGGRFTYEFVAEPFGLFPYHCHIQPLEEHISHGLYGALIIDPKKPRPAADELMMIMNGFDTDFDTENNFYAVNTIPYYYMHHPIQIEKNRLVRIYLLNMLEFDPINNFHLHANMFDFYKTGTKLTPDEKTDIVTMSQAERGISEFKYKFPGKYMFHAHKTEFAEKGWMGTFLVKDTLDEFINENSNDTSTLSSTSYLNPINKTTSVEPTGGLQ